MAIIGKLYVFNIFQNIHVSFLRTLPPYSHQADVWVEMLKQFKYRQLVFIHSSDTDGRALLGRFQTKTQDLQTDDQEVKVRSPTKAKCPPFPALNFYGAKGAQYSPICDEYQTQ